MAEARSDPWRMNRLGRRACQCVRPSVLRDLAPGAELLESRIAPAVAIRIGEVNDLNGLSETNHGLTMTGASVATEGGPFYLER